MLRWKQMGSFAVAALCVLLLGTAAPAPAQTPSKISGSVIDPEGNPFVGLTLKLKNDRGQTAEGKTDEKGRYMFSLPSGRWSIGFYHQDRQVWTLDVNLPSGTEQELPTVNFKEMLEKNPEMAAARKKQAEEHNKFEAMKAYFESGVAAAKQADELQSNLGKAPTDQKVTISQQLQDARQKAIAEFLSAERVADPQEPNRHLILANLGSAYKAAGQYEQAVDAYTRAVALKPQGNYIVGLAETQARLGKPAEGMQACAQIPAATDPANAALCYRNLGIVFYNANQFQEAVEPLQKATQLDPKNPQAWYVLGASLVPLADFKEEKGTLKMTPKPGTIEAYQKAIELDPNGPYGAQAREGLTQLEAMGAGIATSVKAGKKRN